MKKTVVIVHTDFRLYWPARLYALRRYLREREIRLLVVEISGKGSPYSFDTSCHHLFPDWLQLFPERDMEGIGSAEACDAVLRCLDQIRPDLVISGAIAFPSGAANVRWGIRQRKPVIVFDNARLEDVPRSAHVDWVKRQLYSHVDAMLIPAPSHVPSFRYFGFDEGRLFFGINCIDNAFFSRSPARETDDTGVLPLRRPYFLALGRQVEKKNWLRLLQAFRSVADHPAVRDWQLLFIGDGPDHESLRATSGDLLDRRVHFLPFKSQDNLTFFYENAGALVLPSMYGETWGLVVNEAMAAGRPVLVSKKCGCAETLVEEGVNGFLLDPDDQESIESALVRFASFGSEKRSAMGKASERIIEDWGLERFCEGMFNAISRACSEEKRRGSYAGIIISHFWQGRYRPT